MINHKAPPVSGNDDDIPTNDGSRNPPARKPVQPSQNRQPAGNGNAQRPAGPNRQSKPAFEESDGSQSQYPDAQTYYNYFKGNLDNSAGNGNNYYGSNRQGGYFSDGGNVDGAKSNYGNLYNHDSYGNRDKGYLNSYGNRLWQQATGGDRAGGGYNSDYDNYYDNSDGGYNGGSNSNNDGGGYFKNGDYTDYYSSPVDSGTCCHVLYPLRSHTFATSCSPIPH